MVVRALPLFHHKLPQRPDLVLYQPWFKACMAALDRLACSFAEAASAVLGKIAKRAVAAASAVDHDLSDSIMLV